MSYSVLTGTNAAIPVAAVAAVAAAAVLSAKAMLYECLKCVTSSKLVLCASVVHGIRSAATSVEAPSVPCPRQMSPALSA